MEEEIFELESGTNTEKVNVLTSSQTMSLTQVRNRYPPGTQAYLLAKDYILQVLEMNFKNPADNLRNLIRVLLLAVTYREVRVRTSEFLEEWLNNPNIRFTKDLFVRVVQCCRESSREDTVTLSNILKMKLKPAMQNTYYEMVAQILKNNPEYVSTGKLFALRLHLAEKKQYID